MNPVEQWKWPSWRSVNYQARGDRLAALGDAQDDQGNEREPDKVGVLDDEVNALDSYEWGLDTDIAQV